GGPRPRRRAVPPPPCGGPRVVAGGLGVNRLRGERPGVGLGDVLVFGVGVAQQPNHRVRDEPVGERAAGVAEGVVERQAGDLGARGGGIDGGGGGGEGGEKGEGRGGARGEPT